VTTEQILPNGLGISAQKSNVDTVLTTPSPGEGEVNTIAQEAGIHSIAMENVPVLSWSLAAIRLKCDGKGLLHLQWSGESMNRGKKKHQDRQGSSETKHGQECPQLSPPILAQTFRSDFDEILVGYYSGE
jgi:hypothetical protein